MTIDVLPGPDTVVLTRRVEPGCEEAFEDVLRGFANEAMQVAGHEGANILSPEPDGRSASMLVVQRQFRSAPRSQAQIDSDVRVRLVSQVGCPASAGSPPALSPTTPNLSCYC